MKYSGKGKYSGRQAQQRPFQQKPLRKEPPFKEPLKKKPFRKRPSNVSKNYFRDEEDFYVASGQNETDDFNNFGFEEYDMNDVLSGTGRSATELMYTSSLSRSEIQNRLVRKPGPKNDEPEDDMFEFEDLDDFEPGKKPEPVHKKRAGSFRKRKKRYDE